MDIFLDDLRPAPEGWQRTFTVEETIEALKLKCVNKLSLDNDLGPYNLEGYKVLDWLEEQINKGRYEYLPTKIIVHSANPVARQRMMQIINRLY